jgi:cytoskeleton protein RodZ
MTAAVAPALPIEDFYTDLPVGEILRRARMQKGLSISQTEALLHIRASHLEALERSDFDALPGRTYVIGFIRTYAEFLGLDGGRVIHLLKRQTDGLGTPQALNAQLLPTDSRLPSVPLMAVATAALLLIMIVWVAYQNTRIGGIDYRQSPSDLGTIDDFLNVPTPAKIEDSVPASTKLDQVLLEAVATPGPQAAAVPTDTPSSPVTVNAPAATTINAATPAPVATANTESAPQPATALRLVIRQDSWIEIRRPDGRVIEARTFKAGEVFNIPNPIDEFGNAYTMTTSNAAGVEIVLNGRALPPLGGPDQVRRNVSLNPKVLGVLLGDR